MKNCLLFLLLVLLGNPVHASDSTDTILDKLNDALKNKQRYVQLKEERILNFKKIKSDDLTKEQEYNYNKALYTEYQKFNSDSAIFYVKKNLKIADELQDKDLSNLAKIQLVTLYSSSGKYRESEALIKSIDKKTLSKALLPNYYVAYREFFEHYAANSYSVQYMQQIQKYRDSLLMVLDPNSLNYKINKIQQGMYLKKSAAEKQLKTLLENTREDNPQYAMITYLLGSIYERSHQLELRKNTTHFLPPPI